MALANPAAGFLTDPSTGVQANQQNYRSQYDFQNQYLPDYMSDAVEQFNKQSILGFLDSMGYDEALESDQALWGELGRLHKLHTGVTRASNVFTSNGHSVRVGDKIQVNAVATAGVEKGIVTATTTNTFTAAVVNSAAWTVGTTALNVRVYGDEHRKGTDGKSGSLDREFQRYTVDPIISKAVYRIDGSEIPNITWLYDPETGDPYWHTLNERDEYKRFLNNIEFTLTYDEEVDSTSSLASTYKGTQGMFDSIISRGNIFNGQLSSLDDVDSIVERIEQVGGESTYGMFNTTNHNLNINDVLANAVGETSQLNYGIFGMGENSKDIVLKLGFKGWQRGTYEFHHMGWSIFQDYTSLNPNRFNAADRIHGIMAPMGMTTINDVKGQFDQGAPKYTRFLTQMYKAGGGESRKLKSTILGFDYNNSGDYREIHWLTERCLRAVAMKRWFIFRGNA